MISICMLALAILLSACAAPREARVSYNDATGKTTYSSAKALVGNVGMTGGLTSGQRVMMQAHATCDGRDCNPSEIDVAFLNDSSSDLNLDYRRLEIVADGKKMEWEDATRLTEPPHFSVPRGEFIRVPLSRANFSALATAREVEVVFGLTGSVPLRMPPDQRSPLREMLALLEDPGR